MGAPDQACGAMFPGHQFDPQDNSQIPVSFTISPEGPIAPGQSVTIELKSNQVGEGFKGYMVQARRFMAESEKEAAEDLDALKKELKIPLGHFETEESSYLTCGPGIHNTITHRNQKEKAVVSAKWIAPDDYEGEIYFRYTIVIEYATYYVGVETPKIRITRDAEAPTTTTTTTTTTTATPLVESTYFPVTKNESNSENDVIDNSGSEEESKANSAPVDDSQNLINGTEVSEGTENDSVKNKSSTSTTTTRSSQDRGWVQAL